MNYTIIKLDRRHAWHREFTYMIEFPKRSFSLGSSGVLAFDRSRRWFNDTFGWSQDVDTRQRVRVVLGTELLRTELLRESKDYNFKWSWSVKYDEYRIYVESQAELNWFVLKYPQS